MRADRQQRVVKDERGSILIMTALSMVSLLVMVAFALDIGKAYLMQRQLQAAVDASALAGAQHLPDAVEANQVAHEYSPSPGQKNALRNGGQATTNVALRCLQTAPGCRFGSNNYNALVVDAATDVQMSFARVIGIDKLTVRAKATACSPCTSKPLDIMVVLDRTGSMCQFSPGVNDPNCTDLNNARDGIRTFLGYFDPAKVKVGLAVTPPSLDQSWVGSCPNTPWSGDPSGPKPDGQYYGYDSYWPTWIPDPRDATPSVYTLAPLEHDYLIQSMSGAWSLNPGSNLVQRLGCVGGAGSTSYSFSMEEAQYELSRNGRGNVQDVIVFLSDGAANTSPPKLPNGHWANNPTNFQRPCATGVESAQRVKDSGTIVYTIGYDLDGLGSAPERCLKPLANGHQDTSGSAVPEAGGITAYSALQAMASEPGNFYLKPDPGQLNTIFTRIAADIVAPSSRLVDDGTP